VSHLVCKCRILTTSVISVANIILPSFLCHASNDMTGTLRTPQRLVLKRRNQSTRSTSLLPLKEPLKNGFWRGALPYTLSGSTGTPWPSLGERYNALVPLLGERYLFWAKFGLLRRMRERSPQYLKVVGFEYDLKA
jgi:hypothetical protein